VFGYFVAAGPEVWRSAYTWWPAAGGPAPYPRTCGSSSAADAAGADPLQPLRLDRRPSASATRTTECVSISDCKCTAAAAATGGAAWLGMSGGGGEGGDGGGRDVQLIHACNLANIRIREDLCIFRVR